MRRKRTSSEAAAEKSTRAAARQASPLSEAVLREAALRYLARYNTTRARLLAMLRRRVDAQRRLAQADGQDADRVRADTAHMMRIAERVADSLVAARLVDDAAFAEARARRLRREGRSAAQVARHLAERGIDPAAARAAATRDDTAELAGALMLLRRRRLGPFAAAPADRAQTLGVLARAGFGRSVAEAALATGRDEAEQRIATHRRDE